MQRPKAQRNLHKALCCIPLTSSDRFGNWDNTLSDPVQVCIPHPPTPQEQTLSPSPYISVVLLICSIWPWTIKQVEVRRLNETHPFRLSATRCCNDLGEEGMQKEPRRDGSPEPVSFVAPLCGGQPPPAAGVVCSGQRERSGSACLRCKSKMWPG